MNAHSLKLAGPATLLSRHAPAKERGAVLVVALIFLILLTLLALSSSSSSMLQLRMAGSLRNAQQAQLSADTALRGVEWKLWSNAIRFQPLICTDGQVSVDGCVLFNPKSSATYGSTGTVTAFRRPTGSVGTAGFAYKGPQDQGYTSANGNLDETAQLATDPRYLIEDLGRVRAPGAGAQQEFNAGSGADSRISIHAYRITARASGGSQNTVRIAQSVFDAQPNN